MGPTVRFEGTKAFVENVKHVSSSVRDAIENASKACGYLVMNDAKALVPVDTGRLRASLSVNWTGSGKSFGTVSGKVEPSQSGKSKKALSAEDGVGNPESEYPNGFNVAVGTNVEYAEDVEDTNSPYLWPAYAMNQAKYAAMLTVALKMAIEIKGGGRASSFFGSPL